MGINYLTRIRVSSVSPEVATATDAKEEEEDEQKDEEKNPPDVSKCRAYKLYNNNQSMTTMMTSTMT